MDNRDTAFIQNFINPDEYILWKGKPEKGNVFSSRDVAMLPFALFWLVFSLLFEMNIIVGGAPLLYIFFGLPFVFIGFYLVYMAFFKRAFARKETIYVVTNKKLIIKEKNDIKIFHPQELPPMKIQLHKNGNGTIIFSSITYHRRGFSNYTHCILENLPDVMQAQNALNRMKDENLD